MGSVQNIQSNWKWLGGLGVYFPSLYKSFQWLFLFMINTNSRQFLSLKFAIGSRKSIYHISFSLARLSLVWMFRFISCETWKWYYFIFLKCEMTMCIFVKSDFTILITCTRNIPGSVTTIPGHHIQTQLGHADTKGHSRLWQYMCVYIQYCAKLLECHLGIMLNFHWWFWK